MASAETIASRSVSDDTLMRGDAVNIYLFGSRLDELTGVDLASFSTAH